MKLRLISAAAFLFALSLPANAQDVHGFGNYAQLAKAGKQVTSIKVHLRRVSAGHSRRNGHKEAVADPRPRAWCGWWLRQQLGVADRAYNLARKWAGIGTPAHGPAPGVIAVWPHHVGLVTGVPGPGRIILKSGNDSRAVRERERSTRGIIAYRWPPGARWAGL